MTATVLGTTGITVTDFNTANLNVSGTSLRLQGNVVFDANLSCNNLIYSNTDGLVTLGQTTYPISNASIVTVGTITTSVTLATGIPSWVNRVRINMYLINGTTTADQSWLLLGTGATPTYTTSGYVAGCSDGGRRITSTTSFPIWASAGGAANRPMAGNIFLWRSHHSNHTWTIGGNAAYGIGGTIATIFNGYVTLPGALTAVQLTGLTNNINAGSKFLVYYD